MHKRSAHHFWTKIRPISYWYFLIAFVISGSICIYALRQNNLTAIKLYQNVITADKDNSNVVGSLNTLRMYIYSHMNTNLASGPNSIYPPVQLKYSWQRAVAAQQAAANQANQQNSQLYTDAEYYCQKQVPNGFSGRYRIPCVDNYIQTHKITVPAVNVPASLYEFDFQPPFWSPDLAGWSLLATIVLFILFAVRFLGELWIKYQLKRS